MGFAVAGKRRKPRKPRGLDDGHTTCDLVNNSIWVSSTWIQIPSRARKLAAKLIEMADYLDWEKEQRK